MRHRVLNMRRRTCWGRDGVSSWPHDAPWDVCSCAFVERAGSVMNVARVTARAIVCHGICMHHGSLGRLFRCTARMHARGSAQRVDVGMDGWNGRVLQRCRAVPAYLPVLSAYAQTLLGAGAFACILRHQTMSTLDLFSCSTMKQLATPYCSDALTHNAALVAYRMARLYWATGISRRYVRACWRYASRRNAHSSMHTDRRSHQQRQNRLEKTWRQNKQWNGE